MPSTPNYTLPWPSPTDPADVPLDLQKLAQASETALNGFDGRLDALEPGGLVRLADVTLGADAASIDMPAIPQTARNLLLVTNLRSTISGLADGSYLAINGMTTGYIQVTMRASGTAMAVTNGAAATKFPISAITGATAAASNFGGGFILIPNYTDAAKTKVIIGLGGAVTSGTGTDMFLDGIMGLWNNGGAVTRLTLTSGASLRTGSRATLYGLG